jgi:hypothetical protein
MLTMLVGGLLYGVLTNAKAVELARLMFGCGLLVTLMVFATHVVRLLP